MTPPSHMVLGFSPNTPREELARRSKEFLNKFGSLGRRLSGGVCPQKGLGDKQGANAR